MSFKIFTTSSFQKSSKSLYKKYRSLKEDLLNLIATLEENPVQGTPLGNDCYKIRLSIKSKGKAKSGGARVITCVKVKDNFVYLLTIYSKSQKAGISRKELKKLMEEHLE